MKVKLICISLFLLNFVLFSQTEDKLTEKFSNKICECFDKIQEYKEIESRFDSCYEISRNILFREASMEEIKIFGSVGALKSIKNKLIPRIITNCECIKPVVENYLEIEQNLDEKSFPTNFRENDLEELNKWSGKIIAVEGKVNRLETSYKDTPYYELKIGGSKLWIVSMIDTGFENIGNILKVVGYLIRIDKDDDFYVRKYHSENFHLLAFGIVEFNSQKISYFPGSENQIKEWIAGKIPSHEK